MLKKTILVIIRLLLGATFITSALTKFFSMESFELFLLQYNMFSWDMVTFLARILVVLEFVIGILILFKIYFKQVIIICFSTLLFFSIYLLIILAFGIKTENCNCFGNFYVMGPVESLIKNVILLIFTLLVRKEKPFTIKYQSFFTSILTFGLTIGIFINEPPTFILQALYFHHTEETAFDANLLPDNDFSGKKVNFAKGKMVVAVLSTRCHFCFESAKRLSLIYNRSEYKFPLYFILGGHPDEVDRFWQNSGSDVFPFKFVHGKNFLDICHGKVPKILLIEDGIIKETYNGIVITQSNIDTFFESE